jgi:hypothetical protein
MHPVMAFGIRRHSAPSNMHRDCHTLFRALAASMAHDNDLIVEERRWVNNNAINELRDAAANFLLLQAYKFEDCLQQTHLIQHYHLQVEHTSPLVHLVRYRGEALLTFWHWQILSKGRLSFYILSVKTHIKYYGKPNH